MAARVKAIAGEELVIAQRIEWELAQRGWIAVQLSEAMKEQGCPTHVQAIYQIIGKKRRVTLNETTALARCFEVSVEELLTPLKLIGEVRAQELLSKIGSSYARAMVGYAEAAKYLLELNRMTEFDGMKDFVSSESAKESGPFRSALFEGFKEFEGDPDVYIEFDGEFGPELSLGLSPMNPGSSDPDDYNAEDHISSKIHDIFSILQRWAGDMAKAEREESNVESD